MFRRLLTIMFAMLLWSVQAADAAIDHSKEFAGSDSSMIIVVAEESDAGSSKLDGGIACDAGCICYVFHHAWLGDFAFSITQLRIDGATYGIVGCDVAAFLTQPPTRPPLV